VANFYSDQFTRVRAGRRVQANEDRGIIQALHWNFASLAASNIGDVFVCGIIPKGSRVVGGLECHSAMGGTATGAYGTHTIASDGVTYGAVDSAARFLAATSHVAAGSNPLANTIALAYGFETTVDVFLAITNAASAFATAGQLTGYLQYIRK